MAKIVESSKEVSQSGLRVVQILIFKVNGSDSIDDGCLAEVEKQLVGKEGKELYFWIQTDGGSPFSAVRIVKVLQSRFDKIFAIIPDYAMSAGTLMALGCDEIYMQSKSILGPLDLPMEHPRDGSRISALDVQNTITTISSLSDTIAVERYLSLRKYTGLGKAEASKVAYDTATQFVQPIVAQVDPYHLQKCYRELMIGWRYARELLVSRMMKNRPKTAGIVAMRLVNDFPAHEYGICMDEAKRVLYLTINDLGKLDIWNKLKQEVDGVLTESGKNILYKDVNINI